AGNDGNDPLPVIATGIAHLPPLPGQRAAAGETGQAQRRPATPSLPAPATQADQHEQGRAGRAGQPAQPPARDLHHRPLHRELRPRLRIEDAPVAAYRALLRTLPRLVEGLDHVVRHLHAGRVAEEFAQIARFVHPAGHRIAARPPRAGPTGLADHHALAGKRLLDLRVDVLDVPDRTLRR